MPYLKMRDGESVYVRMVGWGKPCVLLHGLALDSRSYWPIIWPHLTRVKFILPDFRGYGRSRPAALRTDQLFEQYAEDVEDILAQLGYDQVLLGGLSMGALVGLQYLARFGVRRVARYLHIDHPAHTVMADAPDLMAHDLVLLAHALTAQGEALDPATPFAQLPADYRERHFMLLTLVLQNSLSANSAKLLAGLLMGSATLRPLSPLVSSADCWHAVLHSVRAYLAGHFDVRAALAGLDVPITFMVGLKNDLFHLGELVHLPARVPQGQLVEFNHSSHLLPLTEPWRFQQEFSRFLQGRE